MGHTFIGTYFFVICIIVVFIFIRFYIKNNSSYSALFSRGLEAFEDCEYENARKLFFSCLEIEPEALEARFNLGLTLMKLNEFELAQKCFEKVLEKNPNNFEALYYLALSLFNQGNYVKAREKFDDLLKMDKDNFNILFNLGLTCQMLKQYDESQEFYKKAVAKNDEDADAHLNWGIVCFEQGQYVKALDLFITANKLSYKRTDVLFLIARCKDELCKYETQEDAEFVIERYRALEQKEDKPVNLEVYIARALAKSGSLDDASELCAKALKEAPKDVVGLRLSGLLHLLKNELEEALESLTLAIKLDIDNIEGYKLLALVYGQKGDVINQVEVNAKYRQLLEKSRLNPQ